jgi:type IV secretory pathway TrbL component
MTARLVTFVLGALFGMAVVLAVMWWASRMGWERG